MGGGCKGWGERRSWAVQISGRGAPLPPERQQHITALPSIFTLWKTANNFFLLFCLCRCKKKNKPVQCTSALDFSAAHLSALYLFGQDEFFIILKNYKILKRGPCSEPMAPLLPEPASARIHTGWASGYIFCFVLILMVAIPAVHPKQAIWESKLEGGVHFIYILNIWKTFQGRIYICVMMEEEGRSPTVSLPPSLRRL